MSEFSDLSVLYINRQMKPEEFNHIVLPLRRSLIDCLQRLTGNDDDAEDIVQEVMLRLWNMRSRIEAGANVSALAYTIARNLHCDRCRHQNCCRSEGEEMLMNIAVEDLRAERNDEMRLISRIVESLPPLQQQIFRMKEMSANRWQRKKHCGGINLQSAVGVKWRVSFLLFLLLPCCSR